MGFEEGAQMRGQVRGQAGEELGFDRVRGLRTSARAVEADGIDRVGGFERVVRGWRAQR